MLLYKWCVPVLAVFVFVVSSDDRVYFNRPTQNTVYFWFHPTNNDRLVADEGKGKLRFDGEHPQSALLLEGMVPSLMYFDTDIDDKHFFNPFKCNKFCFCLAKNLIKSHQCFINEINQPICELFCNFVCYRCNENPQYFIWNYNLEYKTNSEILSETTELIYKTNYLTKSLLSFLKSSEQYSKELLYDLSEMKRKLDELSFSTIPSILRYTENLLASSQVLTKPYLLNFPIAARTVQVIPSSTESISAQFFKKGEIINSRKSLAKNSRVDVNVPEENSNLKSVLRHVYGARQRSGDSEAKQADKSRLRLSLITAEQEKLIHKMTSLQKELGELKVDSSNSPNESIKSRMIVVRKQLEEMDERKSELYYKKLMLSQNSDSY